MVYVFDTNSISVFKNYYRANFAPIWERLDDCVERGLIISVKEVYRELLYRGNITPELEVWVKSNRRMFLKPTLEEMRFVGEILRVPHFQQIISQQERLQGRPVADPFVVASAKIRHGCVVTEEAMKDNSAQIPNVCQHFGIPCTNLEGFMQRENWTI